MDDGLVLSRPTVSLTGVGPISSQHSCRRFCKTSENEWRQRVRLVVWTLRAAFHCSPSRVNRHAGPAAACHHRPERHPNNRNMDFSEQQRWRHRGCIDV